MSIQDDHSLKAGDELAMYTGYSYGKYSIVTVQKVTPSGQIVLTDGSRYDKSGTRIGHESTTTRLEIATDEIRAIIKRMARVEYLSTFPWDRVSDELLDEVMEFMKAHGFDAVK